MFLSAHGVVLGKPSKNYLKVMAAQGIKCSSMEVIRLFYLQAPPNTFLSS